MTTTTFNLLGTTALCSVMIRALAGHGSRWLLIAGLLVGCQVKTQIALVALMMLLAIGVIWPRWPRRSPWLSRT